jgi:hypothetical protein
VTHDVKRSILAKHLDTPEFILAPCPGGQFGVIGALGGGPVYIVLTDDEARAYYDQDALTSRTLTKVHRDGKVYHIYSPADPGRLL